VLAALGIAAGLIVIWLWARVSRTRHVVLQASESVQMAIIHLERIANDMDRIVFLVEARSRAEEASQSRQTKEATPDKSMSVSA
jgi:hypothetical protein